MAIDSLINKLQYVQLEPPDKILSLYLNTDTRDPEQQRGGMEDCPKVRIQPIKRVFGC